MPTVDARGLSCPEPVLRTQRALQAGEFPLVVVVDTAAQRDNVRRTATSAGCQVTVDRQEDEYTLTLTR